MYMKWHNDFKVDMKGEHKVFQEIFLRDTTYVNIEMSRRLGAAQEVDKWLQPNPTRSTLIGCQKIIFFFQLFSTFPDVLSFLLD